MSDRILHLADVKCFESESLHIKPVTILTGVNCGGKTTILQALLALKSEFDSLMANGAESDNSEHQEETTDADPLPDDIGGIPIGSFDGFIRSSGRGSALMELSDGRGKAGIEVAPGRWSFRISDWPSSFLGQIWRVSATSMLELSEQQDVGQRDLGKDKVYDHLHALIELSSNGLRRNNGSGPKTLRGVVEEILGIVAVGTRIDVTPTEFDKTLKLMYGTASLESEPMPPQHYGAGVTALLPLAIHLVMASPGETIICQDPELHLHPRGQSAVGQAIAECSLKGVTCIVETHSEHVVNGVKIGLLRADRDLAASLNCVYLERTASVAVLRAIEFDERGRTRKWPKGYFDQAELDFAELARLGQ
jgi:predicted ATPase